MVYDKGAYFRPGNEVEEGAESARKSIDDLYTPLEFVMEGEENVSDPTSQDAGSATSALDKVEELASKAGDAMPNFTQEQKEKYPEGVMSYDEDDIPNMRSAVTPGGELKKLLQGNVEDNTREPTHNEEDQRPQPSGVTFDRGAYFRPEDDDVE